MIFEDSHEWRRLLMLYVNQVKEQILSLNMNEFSSYVEKRGNSWYCCDQKVLTEAAQTASPSPPTHLGFYLTDTSFLFDFNFSPPISNSQDTSVALAPPRLHDIASIFRGVCLTCLASSMAYGARRFNTEFTRTHQ